MNTMGIKHGEWECKKCHEKKYDIFDKIDLCRKCYYSEGNKEIIMINLYELGLFRTATKGSVNHTESQQLFSEIIQCGALPHKLISFLSVLHDRVKSDEDFVNEFRKLRAIFPTPAPDVEVDDSGSKYNGPIGV